jgi:hypothetical protein
MGTIRGRWDNTPKKPGGTFFGIWIGAELDTGQ